MLGILIVATEPEAQRRRWILSSWRSRGRGSGIVGMESWCWCWTGWMASGVRPFTVADIAGKLAGVCCETRCRGKAGMVLLAWDVVAIYISSTWWLHYKAAEYAGGMHLRSERAA